MATRNRGTRRAEEFPTGGGVAGELIRAIDWSATPVGPISKWPTSLRTVVEMILHSRHPMFLWWGRDLIQFYNDAYLPSFGRGKHPDAMGQRGRDCWQEIWPIIGPQIEGVMERATPTWHEDALVPIFRNGRIEEVYWTYGYSPVFNEERVVGGTLVVCTETTSRVIANRRQRLARLVSEGTALAETPRELLDNAIMTFATAAEDIPFALVLDPAGQAASSCGLTGADAAVVEQAVHAAIRAGELPVFRIPRPISAGPWPDPVTHVFVAMLGPGRFCAFGLSARLPFDDAYRAFLLQLVETIGLAQARRETLALRVAAETERRDLLLQAPVATALLTGRDHLFTLANPLYVEMVGREVIGKTYLEAFPELAGSAILDILDDVFCRGVPFVTDELLLPLDRDGTGTLEDCFFKFNLQPLRDAGGVVYGMMAVAIEITPSVRARQQQLQALEQLQHAHDERTTLVRELESANRAKDEFLAMLGHELRNPLTPIITALELMAAQNEGKPSREQLVIDRQVRHMTRLVDDLLDVAKIARGKVDLSKETVDLREVVTKAIEIASHMLEQRHHELRVDLPSEPIRWWGDPVRLAQVIANLLTNAGRYTDPGGEIAISAARRTDGSVEIEVIDNGVGITPELLPRVFDLFVQGRRRVDRSEGGLGLGLALVKNLVELHSGTVTASSDGPGQGSTFVVTLPPSDPSVTGQPKQRAHSKFAADPKRVLVVDDNVDAASLLADLLRAYGHEVSAVHDAVAALAVFPTFKPDVAIFDIGLPVMDGYELAARIVASGKGACRLVAVTGYGQARDRARAVEVGFDAYLVKPVAIAAVLAAIAGAPA